MTSGAVPEGYHSITPYLIVKEADKLLDFLRAAFGAEERTRMDAPDGTIAHAETVIGDSVVMVGTAQEQGDPVKADLHLYLEDCDGTYARALAAGATSVREPEDQFYGDRMAGVRDPSGTTWWLAQRVEEVNPEEMARRAEQASGTQGS